MTALPILLALTTLLLAAVLRRPGRAPADPELAARIRRSWKVGAGYLQASDAARALPLLVFLSDLPEHRPHPLDAARLLPGPEHFLGPTEFAWRFARDAVWLDFRDDPDSPDDPHADRWRLFAERLAGEERLKGVAVTLRAASLHTADARHRAAGLRRRLDALTRATGRRLPIYLILDAPDGIPGLSAALAALPDGDQPCGRFRPDERQAPGAFAAAVLLRAAADLHRAVAAADRPAAVAHQAPEHLARLAGPLGKWCREAFGFSPYQSAPLLAGVFLGCSGRDGGGCYPALLDALLARDARPRRERVYPAGAGGGRFAALHVMTIGPLLALLGVCWLLTGVYVQSRALIRAAARHAARPDNDDRLRDLLGDTLDLEAELAGRPLGGLGLDAADRLLARLRRRYCEAYTDLVLENRLRDLGRRAVFALEEASPAATGTVLATLTDMRLGLIRAAAGDPPAPAAAGTANSFLNAFLRWAEPDGWMLEVADQISYLENLVAAESRAGDPAAWLPDWADTLPGVGPVSLPAAWGGGTVTIRAAWTAAAYREVERLAGETFPADRRDALLAGYRDQAARAWHDAVRAAWPGDPAAVPAAEGRDLLDRLAAGDGPAARLRRALADHLAPMFADPPGWLARRAGPPDPDLDRRLAAAARALAAPGGALEPVRAAFRRDDGPLTAAGRAATAAAARAGSELWPEASPLADYACLRALALSAAARRVDTLWREDVYQPARLLAGSGTGDQAFAALTARDGYLAEFLGKTLAGLWVVGDDGDAVAAARWEETAFPFSEEFLAYCGALVRRGGDERPRLVGLGMAIDAVNVYPDAAERPETLELAWEDAGGSERLVYRNFTVDRRLEWRLGEGLTARLAFRFPSRTVDIAFSGRREVATLVAALAAGEFQLAPGDFGPDRAVLERMGVTGIAVRGAVRNADEFLRHALRDIPAMPRTIIASGPPPDPAVPPPQRPAAGTTPAAPAAPPKPESGLFSPASPPSLNRVDLRDAAPAPARPGLALRPDAPGSLPGVRPGAAARRATYFDWSTPGGTVQ